MGTIEHTLLDGEFSVRPNRPKTFARNHTIPQKVTDVSIYDQEPGLSAHRHIRNVSKKSGQIGDVSVMVSLEGTQTGRSPKAPARPDASGAETICDG
jgi:hypothetical protein